MALSRLAQEDPSFRVSTDPESGQTILKGMGELHLEIKVDILRAPIRSMPMSAHRRLPIARRSSRPVTIDYTHKKQTGGSGQFAEVNIEFEPLPPGSGFVFENDVVGGSVPKEFIPGGRKGHQGAEGYRRARRLPGDRFQGDAWSTASITTWTPTALAFDIAARAAFREVRAERRRRAARTDHEGRSRDAGRFTGRRHRRSELRGAARCRARISAAMRRSSPPWCRSPTCSATSTRCAR